MKATIIIDIPDEEYKSGLVCNVAVYSPNNDVEPRLYGNVEVKHLPSRRSGGVWNDGWNACLDQITGKIEYE